MESQIDLEANKDQNLSGDIRPQEKTSKNRRQRIKQK